MPTEQELLAQLELQARILYGAARATELRSGLTATAQALAVLWQTPLDLLEEEPDR